MLSFVIERLFRSKITCATSNYLETLRTTCVEVSSCRALLDIFGGSYVPGNSIKLVHCTNFHTYLSGSAAALSACPGTSTWMKQERSFISDMLGLFTKSWNDASVRVAEKFSIFVMVSIIWIVNKLSYLQYFPGMSRPQATFMTFFTSLSRKLSRRRKVLCMTASRFFALSRTLPLSQSVVVPIFKLAEIMWHVSQITHKSINQIFYSRLHPKSWTVKNTARFSCCVKSPCLFRGLFSQVGKRKREKETWKFS